MDLMTRIKKNRAASFILVALVYILAGAFGLAVYRRLDYDWWFSLLIADTAATALTFLFSVLFRNASVYDPYWSVQPLFILAAYAIGKPLSVARVLMLIAVGFWGLRLTANWAYTFHGLSHQDWWYTMLKEKTGFFYPIVNFFGIHLVPTLIVYLCTLPAVYLFLNDAAWNLGTLIFFLLSVGAATMQGIADLQMHRFRKQKSGTFIRTGLWKHSRHPNYLGEILMWWGVAGSALSLFPGAWYLSLGAFANTLLFLGISIPMADRRQAAKPGYAQYAAETRKLFPIHK